MSCRKNRKGGHDRTRIPLPGPLGRGRLSAHRAAARQRRPPGRSSTPTSARTPTGSTRCSRWAPPQRLAAGVEELRLSGAEAVVWACTSGSFVYGWEGAHEQVRGPRPAPRACPPPVRPSPSPTPCGSSARAASRSRRPIRTTWRTTSRTFLKAAGVEVVRCRGSGIITAAEVGTWEWPEVWPWPARPAITGRARRCCCRTRPCTRRPTSRTWSRSWASPSSRPTRSPSGRPCGWRTARVNAPALGALFTREPLVQAYRMSGAASGLRATGRCRNKVAEPRSGAPCPPHDRAGRRGIRAGSVDRCEDTTGSQEAPR